MVRTSTPQALRGDPSGADRGPPALTARGRGCERPSCASVGQDRAARPCAGRPYASGRLLGHLRRDGWASRDRAGRSKPDRDGRCRVVSGARGSKPPHEAEESLVGAGGSPVTTRVGGRQNASYTSRGGPCTVTEVTSVKGKQCRKPLSLQQTRVSGVHTPAEPAVQRGEQRDDCHRAKGHQVGRGGGHSAGKGAHWLLRGQWAFPWSAVSSSPGRPHTSPPSRIQTPRGGLLNSLHLRTPSAPEVGLPVASLSPLTSGAPAAGAPSRAFPAQEAAP